MCDIHLVVISDSWN